MAHTVTALDPKSRLNRAFVISMLTVKKKSAENPQRRIKFPCVTELYGNNCLASSRRQKNPAVYYYGSKSLLYFNLPEKIFLIVKVGLFAIRRP